MPIFSDSTELLNRYQVDLFTFKCHELINILSVFPTVGLTGFCCYWLGRKIYPTINSTSLGKEGTYGLTSIPKNDYDNLSLLRRRVSTICMIILGSVVGCVVMTSVKNLSLKATHLKHFANPPLLGTKFFGSLIGFIVGVIIDPVIPKFFENENSLYRKNLKI